MNIDDPQAWERHVTASDFVAGDGWSRLDRREPAEAFDPPAAITRLVAAAWPDTGEPLTIAVVSGSELGTARLARRWGLNAWPADADLVEFPPVPGVTLLVDTDIVHMTVSRQAVAHTSRPPGWPTQKTCTLGLIAMPGAAIAATDGELAHRFQGAVSTGAAYVGDIVVVDRS